MSSHKGKASTSGKRGKKSTRKMTKLELARARAKLKVEDLYEDPKSGYVSSFTQDEIDQLFYYDSSSDLSDDNYDKLASDYDLLLNDVELLEAKEKLWNSEREALQKQISLLKQEYETIQKKVTDLESRLDAATNAAQAGLATRSANSLANAAQAPDVIAPAVKSRNKKKKPAALEKKDAEQVSKTDEKGSTEEQVTATSDQKPSQAKPSEAGAVNPASEKPLPKEGSKGQKKRTQDVIYVRPEEGKTFIDLLRTLRGCAELLKEPLMIDPPKRVPKEVMMVLCKSSADSAVVERLVRETVGHIGKVTKKTPMTTITCTNLGGSTAASDLQKAILDRHGVKVELDNVQLQKSRKGKTQQARIKLPIRDARKLDGRKLLVGTSTVIFQTEVLKTSEEERCFRCLVLGHMAHQCPETNSLCYRCGKDGHQAAECKNMPKCLDCDGGHPTGSRKCVKSSKAEVPAEEEEEEEEEEKKEAEKASV